MKKQLEELQKLSMELYSPIKDIREQLNIIVKESNEKICDEGFITIDDIEFNISLVFDDTSYNKEDNCLYIMNLFFAEIISNKSDRFLRNNFPSFFKLQKEIDRLNQNKTGYIAIGKKANVSKENDVSWTFKNIKEFNVFANKYYENTIELYTKIIEEIKNYSDNLKILTISDTKIVNEYSNGRRSQEVLFKCNNNLFKISIVSESYESQSYGTLELQTKSDGWSELKSINPKRDYRIDISYSTNYNQNIFAKKIIEDFKELATKI
jgi:hypothetical protein